MLFMPEPSPKPDSKPKQPCRTVLTFTVGSDSFHAEGPCTDVQGWLATWLALRTESPAQANVGGSGGTSHYLPVGLTR